MSDTRKVRVVAVDDEALTLAMIKSALAKEPRIELVGTGVNGREALQLANRLRPDVVVLDVNMPVFNGLEAAARIRAAFPSIAVLMLTAKTDAEIVIAALRAGATEYLSKSTEIMNIGAAILKAAGNREASAPDRGMAFMWTFYGPKGSSGTSTLAANAAVHLAQLHYRVLLVDLDMMNGDLAFILGMQPRPPREHLLTQLEELGELDAYTVARTVRSLKLPGMGDHALHVLDSPATFVPLEGTGEEKLTTLMEFVMACYDYVVVDIAPGRVFDRAMAPMLDLSERVFVTSNRDLSSMKSVISLCRVLLQTSFSMNKLSLVFAGMIPNPSLDHLSYMAKQELGLRSMIDMPVDTEAAAAALAAGMPSVLSDPNAAMSLFARNLVEEALNLPPTHGQKGTRWNSIVKNFKSLLGR